MEHSSSGWVVVGILFLATLACLGTLLAALAYRSWLGDLACHFRPQYAWILLGTGLLLLIAGKWLPAFIVTGFSLANFALLFPLYLRITLPRGCQTKRILLVNVWQGNRSYGLLQKAICNAKPDLVVLLEATQKWAANLYALEAEYPFSESVVDAQAFGILLLSRIPFEKVEVVRFGRAELPSLVADLKLEGQQLTIIATHPLWPITPAYAQLRNQQMEQLASFVKQKLGPLMVVGDLNTTPWAPIFRNFIRESNLRDSRQGFGLQPTWPVYLPFFRIPLDHCLVSPEIGISQWRLGPNIGSDHYPVIVDFSIESETRELNR